MLRGGQLIGFGGKKFPPRAYDLGSFSGSGNPDGSETINWAGNPAHAKRRLFFLASTRRSNDNISHFGSVRVFNGSTTINLTEHQQVAGASGSQDRSNTAAIWSGIVPNNTFTSLLFTAPSADGWGITLVTAYGLKNATPTDSDGAGTSSPGSVTGDIVFTNNKDDIVLAVATGYGGDTGGSWSEGAEVADLEAGGCHHSAMVYPRRPAETDATYVYTYPASQFQRSWAGISWG